jgi:hypothetical protein
VIGIDAPEHGSRGVPNADLAQSVFEFFALDDKSGSFDLRRARDNFRQMAADQLQLVRLIEQLATLDVLPVGAPDGVPDLDPAQILYIGHSFGSVLASTALAVAPEIQAACLNVGGNGLMTIMRESATFQLLVKGLRPPGLTDGDLARFFAFSQAIIDPGDPINFAPYVSRGAGPGVEGWRPRHLLLQEVHKDSIVPNLSTELLARGLGLAHGGRVVRDVGGMPLLPAPLSGNLEGGVTGAYVQFDRMDGKAAEHGGLIFSEEGRAQYVRFFRDVVDGKAVTVIDPYKPLLDADTDGAEADPAALVPEHRGQPPVAGGGGGRPGVCGGGVLRGGRTGGAAGEGSSGGVPGDTERLPRHGDLLARRIVERVGFRPGAPPQGLAILQAGGDVLAGRAHAVAADRRGGAGPPADLHGDRLAAGDSERLTPGGSLLGHAAGGQRERLDGGVLVGSVEASEGDHRLLGGSAQVAAEPGEARRRGGAEGDRKGLVVPAGGVRVHGAPGGFTGLGVGAIRAEEAAGVGGEGEGDAGRFAQGNPRLRLLSQASGVDGAQLGQRLPAGAAAPAERVAGGSKGPEGEGGELDGTPGRGLGRLGAHCQEPGRVDEPGAIVPGGVAGEEQGEEREQAAVHHERRAPATGRMGRPVMVRRCR